MNHKHDTAIHRLLRDEARERFINRALFIFYLVALGGILAVVCM